MIRYGLLDEPLLSVTDVTARRTERLTLPALYAALVRDEVGDFPALRPHQRHVWHAFLVQVAALALHRAGTTELPDDAAAWRTLLLALTPGDPDGTAWALVTPHNRPALLQPPVPGGDVSAFKYVETPDALDMLVTSKNHDVKRSIMPTARPEHWLYALVSLQTQEGFLGAGNYGISRMNGGFASRPGFGIEPGGGLGARARRDVTRLLALRSRTLFDYPFYPDRGGIGLVWLVPWDGKTSLAPEALDPCYVEVCRRVRLASDDHGDDADGALHALATGSTAARIDAKALKGRTGDPWTPLMPDGAGRKALTLDAGGLSYKRLVPLLFPRRGDSQATVRAPLQEVAANDEGEGLSVLARAVVRGQGVTEGFHERRVPVSRVVRRFMIENPTDEVAAAAAARVEDASTFARRVLYPAALEVYTAAPSANERRRDDDTAKTRAGAALATFDARVDASFFADLDAELEHLGHRAAMDHARATWLLRLYDHGREVLDRVLAGAPTAAMRHYRTRVRATDRFARAFRRHFGERITDAPASQPTSGDDHTEDRS